jgi:hypothetical protein
MDKSINAPNSSFCSDSGNLFVGSSIRSGNVYIGGKLSLRDLPTSLVAFSSVLDPSFMLEDPWSDSAG